MIIDAKFRRTDNTVVSPRSTTSREMMLCQNEYLPEPENPSAKQNLAYYYSEMIAFTNAAFELLNGWVNRVNIIPTIYFAEDRDEIVAKGSSNAIAYLDNSVNEITINLPLALSTHIEQYKSVNMRELKISLLWTLTHELSHADQPINPKEYSRVMPYREKIEREANFLTIKFIYDNEMTLIDALFDGDDKVTLQKPVTDETDIDGSEYLLSNYTGITIDSFYQKYLIQLLLLSDYDTDRMDQFGSISVLNNGLGHYFDVEFIYNGKIFRIKYNGVYNPDTRTFNLILAQIRRDCFGFMKFVENDKFNPTQAMVNNFNIKTRIATNGFYKTNKLVIFVVMRPMVNEETAIDKGFLVKPMVKSDDDPSEPNKKRLFRSMFGPSDD